jgi:hypothetical protein
MQCSESVAAKRCDAFRTGTEPSSLQTEEARLSSRSQIYVSDEERPKHLPSWASARGTLASPLLTSSPSSSA